MKTLSPTPFFSIAVLLAFINSVVSDSFTNPASGTTDLSIHYTLGDKVVITWDTSIDTVTLIVSHWNGNDVGVLLSQTQNTGSYTWTIGEDDNIDDAAIQDSPNFVLLIRDPTGNNNSGISGWVDSQLSSPGFVLKSNNAVSSSSQSSSSSSTTSSSTKPTSSSTTSSSTTSTSSFTTLTSSTSTSTAAPTNTASSSPDTAGSSSGGLSTGAKAGIAIAAAIGGLLLLGLGIFFGMRWTRKSKAAEGDQPGSSVTPPYYPPGPHNGELEPKPYAYQPPSELPSSGTYPDGGNRVYEMGSTRDV